MPTLPIDVQDLRGLGSVNDILAALNDALDLEHGDEVYATGLWGAAPGISLSANNTFTSGDPDVATNPAGQVDALPPKAADNPEEWLPWIVHIWDFNHIDVNDTAYIWLRVWTPGGGGSTSKIPLFSGKATMPQTALDSQNWTWPNLATQTVNNNLQVPVFGWESGKGIILRRDRAGRPLSSLQMGYAATATVGTRLIYGDLVYTRRPSRI